jgi:hypothetical protein
MNANERRFFLFGTETKSGLIISLDSLQVISQTINCIS